MLPTHDARPDGPSPASASAAAAPAAAPDAHDDVAVAGPVAERARQAEGRAQRLRHPPPVDVEEQHVDARDGAATHATRQPTTRADDGTRSPRRCPRPRRR